MQGALAYLGVTSAPRLSCFSPSITKCSISHCISFVTICSKQRMPRTRSVIRSIFLFGIPITKSLLSAFYNNICNAHSLGGHNSTKLWPFFVSSSKWWNMAQYILDNPLLIWRRSAQIKSHNARCWRKTHLRDENYENNDHRHWSRWRQFCGARDTDAWGPLRPKSSWRQRGLRPLHSCIRAALLRLGSFFATHFSFRLHLFWCWDEHHAGQKWLNQEKHARIFFNIG